MLPDNDKGLPAPRQALHSRCTWRITMYMKNARWGVGVGVEMRNEADEYRLCQLDLHPPLCSPFIAVVLAVENSRESGSDWRQESRWLVFPEIDYSRGRTAKDFRSGGSSGKPSLLELLQGGWAGLPQDLLTGNACFQNLPPSPAVEMTSQTLRIISLGLRDDSASNEFAM